MALMLRLPPELEQRLEQAAAQQGVPAEDYMIHILDEHLPPADRRQALHAVLQEWIDELKSADLSVEDEDGDEFLRALDANRLSDRPLYPPELKGKTW
ncbi:MAG: hypothetical protein U0232_21170 [Thermomicrobiales bacterium]